MLVLQDIAVTYQNTVPAVQGVSLEVPDKAVVALLGANGAGKTTIFRAISGLLNIHKASIVRGSISFNGERIDQLNATQIVQRGIAQVLEGRRLFADLTVDENLRTGALASRDPAAVRRAYERGMVQQIRKIISEIYASGTAVLLVEQNAQMALAVANYGYVLETGKVVLAQPAAELLQEESVRKFYLGLHEGGERSNMGTLRLRRPERRWSL